LCDIGPAYIHRTRHAAVARTDIAAPVRWDGGALERMP